MKHIIIVVSFYQASAARIVLIGAGPTSLGALYRLYDIGILSFTQIQVIVLEQEVEPGGLASSKQDSKGFLWNIGRQYLSSQYKYFNSTMNIVTTGWNCRTETPFIYTKCADKQRKFIPYPFQGKIQFMDKKFQGECIKGLAECYKDELQQTRKRPRSNVCGSSTNVFMKKLYKKVLEVNTTEISSFGKCMGIGNVSELAVKSKIAITKESHDGGVNSNQNYFHFPKYCGAGEIWKGIAQMVPNGWFHYENKVIELDVKKKRLKVKAKQSTYHLEYDVLISTTPIDNLINMISSDTQSVKEMQMLTKLLNCTSTHIIGLGLRGNQPKSLKDKLWIYFPDSDAPFYCATVFSSRHGNDTVTVSHGFKDSWSLMFEATESKVNSNKSYWTEENLVEETIRIMVKYNYISRSQIISRYYYHINHGYPMPSLKREFVLGKLHNWLHSYSIYSRGFLGGWRHEVGNQEQSFMQGVETVDYILADIPEETYSINCSRDTTDRLLKSVPNRTLNYEFVVAHFKEDMEWLLPHANHIHVYHKELYAIPDFRFQMWTNIPNVGKEGYAYLHHIIDNYENLANITVFIQGNFAKKERKDCYFDDIFEYVVQAKAKGLGFKSPRLLIGKDWEENNMDLKWKPLSVRKNITIGQYWEKYFGFPHPKAIIWNARGCFSVTRERVLQRPKQFYERIMSTIDYAVHPLEGYYLERLWLSIFSVFEVTT